MLIGGIMLIRWMTSDRKDARAMPPFPTPKPKPKPPEEELEVEPGWDQADGTKPRQPEASAKPQPQDDW